MAGSEPGWYQADGDPPDTERYWDGSAWQGPPHPIQAPEGVSPGSPNPDPNANSAISAGAKRSLGVPTVVGLVVVVALIGLGIGALLSRNNSTETVSGGSAPSETRNAATEVAATVDTSSIAESSTDKDSTASTNSPAVVTETESEPVDPLIAVGSAGFRRRTIDVFGCRSASTETVAQVGDGVLLFSSVPSVPSWWIEVGSSPAGRWDLREVAGAVIAIRQGTGQINLSETAANIGDQLVIVGPDSSSMTAQVVATQPGRIETDLTEEPPAGSIVLDPSGALVGFAGLDAGRVFVVARVDSTLGNRVVVECGSTNPGLKTSTDWWSVEAETTMGLLGLQRLSDAFARGDWATARSLDVEKSRYTNQRFQEGWGALRESVILPRTMLSSSGDVQRWRLGLLGHEIIGGREVSTLFCVTWEIDMASGVVTQFASESEPLRTLDNPIQGWPAFSELADMLRPVC